MNGASSVFKTILHDALKPSRTFIGFTGDPLNINTLKEHLAIASGAVFMLERYAAVTIIHHTIFKRYIGLRLKGTLPKLESYAYRPGKTIVEGNIIQWFRLTVPGPRDVG